jgi:hypothetical protein
VRLQGKGDIFLMPQPLLLYQGGESACFTVF